MSGGSWECLEDQEGWWRIHALSSRNLQTEFWSREVCANVSFTVKQPNFAPWEVNWPLVAIMLCKIFIGIQILQIIWKIGCGKNHCVKLGKLFFFFFFLVQSAQQWIKHIVVVTTKWSSLKCFRGFAFTGFYFFVFHPPIELTFF